jgi:hypothetical protein
MNQVQEQQKPESFPQNQLMQQKSMACPNTIQPPQQQTAYPLHPQRQPTSYPLQQQQQLNTYHQQFQQPPQQLTGYSLQQLNGYPLQLNQQMTGYPIQQNVYGLQPPNTLYPPPFPSIVSSQQQCTLPQTAYNNGIIAFSQTGSSSDDLYQAQAERRSRSRRQEATHVANITIRACQQAQAQTEKLLARAECRNQLKQQAQKTFDYIHSGEEF